MKPYATRADGIVTRGGGVPTLSSAEAAVLRSNVLTPWGQRIQNRAAAVGLPWWWVAGVVYAESAGNPNALRTEPSGQTGVGLMQITDPGLKAGHSDAELRDPDLNLRIGTAAMAALHKAGNAELPAVASAYNCGPGKDGRAKERPDSAWGLCEAAGYLDRVVGAANVVRLETQTKSRSVGSAFGLGALVAVAGAVGLFFLGGRR